MRIQHLNLLRYGKFTDQLLSFPHARQDFHLIVGANEAGKSTTRSAILDLLYGIETRSTLDFLHAKADMRLGASIEHDGAALEFIRTKARTKTLQSASGSVLAETSLTPFLGSTDRAFFDQMFGLDHTRLKSGGDAILSASNDIGEILFQSAAGIGSLGAVRDQLEAEADKLWARRRSGDRAYYIASDELARAEAALKAVTVRTRDWLEAVAKVQELEDRRELLRGRYRGFEAERIRFERVRRVATALRQLRECQAEMLALGNVTMLAQDATQQLAAAELELAGAQSEQQLFAAQVSQARERLSLIHPDERVLKHEADIARLAERRQVVQHHERDIDRRQIEVNGLWQQVEALVRQLGWPALTEPALTEKIPNVPARAVVASLVKRVSGLDQARRSTEAAAIEKAADLQALEAQLRGLSVTSVPPALRAALAAAQALGDLATRRARDDALAAKCTRDLATAVVALGRWSLGATALRAMELPLPANIGKRLTRHAEAKAQGESLADKQVDLAADLAAQDLGITQYRNAHHPLSAAELAQVRAERDAVWRVIRSGSRPIEELATGFETKVSAADNVSDQRHEKAREVSELQSRLDARERLQQQATENARRHAANAVDQAALDTDWAQTAAALGLAGLPLQEFEPWRIARDKALHAQDALAEAQQAVASTQHIAQTAAADLRTALAGANIAGIAVDATTSFAALVLIASDAVEAATKGKIQHDEWIKQRDAAAAGLTRSRERARSTQAEFDAWTIEWRAGLLQIGLPETTDVASAEDALAVLAEIDSALKAMHDTRRTRIDAMRQDLGDFKQEVAEAAAAAAPGLSTHDDPAAAAAELSARRAKALDDKKESDRLNHDIAALEGRANVASARVAKVQASLSPLLHLAGASSHDELRAMIARSDRYRQIDAAATAAKKLVEEGGDGLTLDALEAEIGATDAAQIPVLMADITRQLGVVHQEQEAVTAELTLAGTELARIAGQDGAARAESERQDALAKMANAAERYIKVHTASRLLKWAVDRYRETRQGPMLTRASEIFCALTLGSFQRLTVEHESDPPILHGRRADGSLVAIAGMSDGTRDQLYLALRLAALEMQLSQGHALPFIADDLFINYDDRRSTAGLEALARLAEKTQVIFLSHHDHLISAVQAVFGQQVNVISLV